MQRNKTPAEMRRTELAKIHIARQALGLDDDTYRDVLWAVCRVKSSADLDSKGRFKLIKHFESLGFKAARKKAPKTSGRMTSEQMGKIEALLADAGRPWGYAHGMARQMFKRDRLEWITVGEARKLIAALEYESQKRRARERVEEVLRRLNRDKSWLESQYKLPKNWWSKPDLIYTVTADLEETHDLA